LKEQLKKKDRKNQMKTAFIFALLLIIIITPSNFKAQDGLKLKEGMKAPNFNLKDHIGKNYKLSSFKGKSVVVIYFYPKAGTAGCTKQACGIRDDYSKFKEKNIIVLGISTDSKKELRRFVREQKLNFPLLTDEKKIVSEKYGVLREDGRDKRITFIVDKKGVIARIIEVADVSSHANLVFEIASQF
jgi:peroxiredoxin Q/BCP